MTPPQGNSGWPHPDCSERYHTIIPIGTSDRGSFGELYLLFLLTSKVTGRRSAFNPFSTFTNLRKLCQKMARFRPAQRQRSRYLLFTGIIATIFLYTYLSTDTLSSPAYDTKYYTTQSSNRPPKSPIPKNPTRIQFDFKANGSSGGDTAKAQAVVDVLKRTFWKYKLKAWGMDEITPITGGYQNTRYSHSTCSIYL